MSVTVCSDLKSFLYGILKYLRRFSYLPPYDKKGRYDPFLFQYFSYLRCRDGMRTIIESQRYRFFWEELC